MKPQHVLGSLAALAIASALVLPSRTEAFTTIGGNLGLTQRDYRVFNNFTDPTANDNATPDANFPGYTGVAMAMWKANLDWSSRLHGNGNGDPHQPGGLGSGGANFDPSWQGYATGIGGTNDNIISELAGSSGATLAFCETPIADGWRIRVYADAAIWNDGPTTPNNQFDLQGVICHELGHALGLGHTTVVGATMEAAVANPAVASRSIAADDIAGVQAIYGVAAAGKPIISGIATAPGQLTINGSNFSGSGNEVWFTQLGSASNGDPVKLTGVASNGVQIVVNVPVNAGPGDVLVKISGAGNDKLSNPWPFQPDNGPTCPLAFNSCFTSPNSVDAVGAVMGYAGTQSIAANNLVLLASGCPPNASGIFYYGSTETFTVFGNGYRCVGSPVFRLGILQVNLFGDAIYNLNQNALPGPISSGQTKFFQFWYRNPAAGGAGFNLSDSLGVPFCP
ncbi:MAG: matrixin family metalloprotease [Planctomycetota bacterium]|nr:matrixin family metalloprotease [Planctomycetota bacterium]